MKKLLLNLKFAKFEVTLQIERELWHTAFFDIFVSQLTDWGTGGSTVATSRKLDAVVQLTTGSQASKHLIGGGRQRVPK